MYVYEILRVASTIPRHFLTERNSTASLDSRDPKEAKSTGVSKKRTWLHERIKYPVIVISIMILLIFALLFFFKQISTAIL